MWPTAYALKELTDRNGISWHRWETGLASGWKTDEDPDGLIAPLQAPKVKKIDQCGT